MSVLIKSLNYRSVITLPKMFVLERFDLSDSVFISRFCIFQFFSLNHIRFWSKFVSLLVFILLSVVVSFI